MGGGDGDEAVAEEAEGDVDACGGGCGDCAGEALEGAAGDADACAGGRGCRGELDGEVGLSEHLAQCVDLGRGDDCGAQGACGGALGEEAVDAGEAEQVGGVVAGGVDEDDGGDDYALHLSQAVVAPEVCFGLGGCKGGYSAEVEALGYGFFAAVVDDGGEPEGR